MTGTATAVQEQTSPSRTTDMVQSPESLVTTDTVQQRIFVEPISMMVTDTAQIPAEQAEPFAETNAAPTQSPSTTTPARLESEIKDEESASTSQSSNLPGAKAENTQLLPTAMADKQKPVEVEHNEEQLAAPSKMLEPEEAEIKGIDTVDLEDPRGNWLFKRIWWNRAENKYEKIRALFGNILESRMLFFTKRSTADKDLFAPFYFEIGMSNTELQNTVAQLIDYIEKERKQGTVSASGREIVNVLMSEKKSLEAINTDIMTVNKLDIDIDETVKKMMDQIDRARKYEREAWNSFKEIAHVLSDKKARELFYQMDTAHNNLKDIQEYVGQALSVHLDRVVNMAKSQIDRIKDTIDRMKKKGYDLKTLVEKISQKATAKPTPAEEEETAPEEEEEQGFFARTISAITSGIVGVWDTIVYVVTWPFTWFSSSEEEQEPSEESGEEPSEHSESEEEAS